MALIAAVIGSVLGALLGVISMVFFETSFLGAVAVYALTSLGCVFSAALAMLMKSDERLAGYNAYEDELDADWQAFETRTRRLSAEESKFQTEMNTPFEGGERRESRDRRKSDRRAG